MQYVAKYAARFVKKWCCVDDSQRDHELTRLLIKDRKHFFHSAREYRGCTHAPFVLGSILVQPHSSTEIPIFCSRPLDAASCMSRGAEVTRWTHHQSNQVAGAHAESHKAGEADPVVASSIDHRISALCTRPSSLGDAEVLRAVFRIPAHCTTSDLH